jgi:hypothetical protein
MKHGTSRNIGEVPRTQVTSSLRHVRYVAELIHVSAPTEPVSKSH